MSLTPEEFNKIASKNDLDRVEGKIDVLEVKFDKMMSVLDGVAKDLKDIKSDRVANMAAHDRFEERITVIEKKLELKPAGSY